MQIDKVQSEIILRVHARVCVPVVYLKYDYRIIKLR